MKKYLIGAVLVQLVNCNWRMKTKFIIGLGNIGNQYEKTRHNIGFEILNNLKAYLEQKNFSFEEKKIKKIQAKIFFCSDLKLYLIYPQTYMNNSGLAVRTLIGWYKITDLKNLLIVYDDISLVLGRLKWVLEGGAGGQHGIESIIENLGGKKFFPRLKFGIGSDPGGDKRANYVLSSFKNDELSIAEKSIKIALESIELFITEKCDLSQIMNKFNGLA